MIKISIPIILVVVSLFLPYSLFAQTSTWTGGVSSDWNSGDNWSPVGVPGSSYYVTIPASGTVNRPTLTHNVVVYQLILSGEIDMKGHSIDAQGGGFIINNAIVKNSNTGSTSSFFGENHESSETFRIDGSTFEGNIYFKILSDLPQYEAYEAGNQYKGNVEFSFAHKLPRSGEYTNPSICKNYPSVFEKNLYVSLNEFGNTQELDIADGGIIFSGSSDTEISGYFGNWPTLGIGPLRLVMKDATIIKTGSAKVTLEEDWALVDISNSLSFEGGIIESIGQESSITFQDNAFHTGASDISHIKGKVYKIGDDAFTFPIGSGSKYAPVSISAPMIPTDVFSVRYFGWSPSISGFNVASKEATLTQVYDNGFWGVERNAGSSNVLLTLGYNVASGVINDQAKLRVAHWVGSSWENLGNGGTSGSTTFGTVSSVSVVSNFSPFAIAEAPTPMPVKLVAFSARKENQISHLQWTTTEETNSNLFEIEHSQDAKKWLKIGERKAQGESKSAIHYDYIHTTPALGLNYYRLKMIDTDGSYAFSRIENLKFSTEVKTAVYPNPVVNKLFIEPTTGETVLSAEIKAANGISALNADEKELKSGIDLTGLSNGIYLLETNMSNGQKEIHKILIQK